MTLLMEYSRQWLVVFVLTLALTAAAQAATLTVEGWQSAAIAEAVQQSKAGDTVQLAAGTYLISEPVRLKSGTTLRGAGQDHTILRFAGEDPMVMVQLSALHDVEVSHLTLDAASSPQVEQGVYASDAQRLNLHHLTIRNLVAGESFGPHGVHFTGRAPSSEHGVTDSIIADCLIHTIGLDSPWGAGIRFSWGSHSNQALRNTLRDTGRGGILADNGSSDLVIRGNRISGSGRSAEGLGIEVWGGCDRCVIEDNVVDHWLSISGCDYVAVRRNVISEQSGAHKFIGLELIGSYGVFTDNLVDDGAQIGLSLSGGQPKNYSYWSDNTFRSCIQWAAQFQGEAGGINHHYLYRCRFNNTSVGRGERSYPGHEGHGFRTNGNTTHLVFEECEFAHNGRAGLQLGGGGVDFLSFTRAVIRDNQGPAVIGPSEYTALEWVDCVVEGNETNLLPPARPFPSPPPMASLRAPRSVTAGRPVRLTSASQARAGRLAVALWDLGEGIPLTGERVTHAYEQPGEYRITLVVWDEAGRGARAEHTLQVVAPDREADLPGQSWGQTVGPRWQTWWRPWSRRRP